MMKKSLGAYAVVVATMLSVTDGMAQDTKMDHSKMGHGAPPVSKSAETPSTKAFVAANDRMHKEMAIKFSGNADADFVAGMIPHHEGAVAMAKVVLEHGKDAKVRKLAQDIIKAQAKEIAWMKAWQKANVK